MTYTIVGDLHCTPKNLDTCSELFGQVEELGNPVIMLGDTFDTKEIVRGKALNLVYNKVKNSKLEWIFLIGNHDLFNLTSEEHSLETLKILPNVTIVDKTTVIDKLVFIPYIYDQEKLRAEIKRTQAPDRTLIAHLEISQFDLGNGHLCTSGLTHPDVAGFKRVISGHFHKYQTKGNLTYLGTPFSHSFGEANQVKYLGEYYTKTDKLKIQETFFPKHISQEINCDSPEPPKFSSNKDFYRVILTGSQANIDLFSKTPYSALNIKWISRPSDNSDNSVMIEETSSNETQFTKWAMEIKEMDEETVKLGLSIMEACR